ncbi:MAG: sulfur carrier protein ThiS [Pseudomonadota bacterium]
MNAPLPKSASTTLTVNGVAQTTTARTLAQWVQEQGQLPNAVATALNGQFVPRAQRDTHMLAGGDTIVTFQPIEGG